MEASWSLECVAYFLRLFFADHDLIQMKNLNNFEINRMGIQYLNMAKGGVGLMAIFI